MKDLAAARGAELLGVPSTKIGEKGESFSGDDNSKGMAPQPVVSEGFSIWGLGFSITVIVSKIFGLKFLFLSVLVKAEDISQSVFGRFFALLYAMMVAIAWDVFRWLMNHLALLSVPQLNRQMVENAELMVRLALKNPALKVVAREKSRLQLHHRPKTKKHVREKMNDMRKKITDQKKEEKPRKRKRIEPKTQGK